MGKRAGYCCAIQKDGAMQLCDLGCLGFLRDRLYKCFGEIHEDIHFENGIVVCDSAKICPW